MRPNSDLAGSVIYPNCPYIRVPLEFSAMDDEPERSLPCTHCGEQHSFPVSLVEQYAGRKITRWCSTCQNLIDIEMPPKEKPSG